MRTSYYFPLMPWPHLCHYENFNLNVQTKCFKAEDTMEWVYHATLWYHLCGVILNRASLVQWLSYLWSQDWEDTNVRRYRRYQSVHQWTKSLVILSYDFLRNIRKDKRKCPQWLLQHIVEKVDYLKYPGLEFDKSILMESIR